ncbi:hypothetical protein BGX33_007113 [Mortierella sp. NVP41]|nr:hypothetical protein BGX33_007113 [Mortierella sp. NVP41]
MYPSSLKQEIFADLKRDAYFALPEDLTKEPILEEATSGHKRSLRPKKSPTRDHADPPNGPLYFDASACFARTKAATTTAATIAAAAASATTDTVTTTSSVAVLTTTDTTDNTGPTNEAATAVAANATTVGTTASSDSVENMTEKADADGPVPDATTSCALLADSPCPNSDAEAQGRADQTKNLDETTIHTAPKVAVASEDKQAL